MTDGAARYQPTDPPLELIDIPAAPVSSPPVPATDKPRRSAPRSAVMAVTVICAALALSTLTDGGLGGGTVPVEPLPAPAAVTGMAELLVATYLTEGAADGGSVLHRIYPSAPAGPAASPGSVDATEPSRFVTQAVAVAADHDETRGWAVTVAADVLVLDGDGYRRDGLHHYLVGILETDEGAVATSLPARIHAPGPAEVPAVAAGSPVDDQSLIVLVGAFLDAYTTGSADLRPFVSAESRLRPLSPRAYHSVRVDQVTAVSTGAGTLHVRSVGSAVDVWGGQLPLEHHLLVATEGGVWKVVEVVAGPPTAAAVAGPIDADGGGDPASLPR